MRPVIAREAKRSSRGGSSRRRIGPRARASAGRPYPAVNCEIDGAPALFPLIAPLVLVSSDHHAASPYPTGSPHVGFAPIASAVGTAAKRAERTIRLMTGVGSKPVIAAMSVARPLFHRKRTVANVLTTRIGVTARLVPAIDVSKLL